MTASPSHDTTGFYEILRRRERGKLKVYVGSAAGTGKTYRMLQEAHELRRRGVDVLVGFAEPHGRAETSALLRDLEVIPRRVITYRTVQLEEMDLEAIVARRPQVALVDELAHTNVPGSLHRKRWEDVRAILDEGISVISAVNVQHLESLNHVIQRTLGVTVRETIPDWVLANADQVINLDISAEDLRQRLREGKIYPQEKVPSALRNFFTSENLTTLRELALREVASSVDRTREEIVRREEGRESERRSVDRIMVAMSSNPTLTAQLLRRASRIAGRLNTDWYCVYVQTPDESAARMASQRSRTLQDNIQMAQQLGATVVTLSGNDIVETLLRFARVHAVALILAGEPSSRSWRRRFRRSVVQRLIAQGAGYDVLVVSLRPPSDQAGGEHGARMPFDEVSTAGED